MVFPDYCKKIKDNRQSFIDYYVSEFGEDKRTMLEERFDRLKFVFFATPSRIKDYIDLNVKYVEATIDFFTEIGLFDKSKIIIERKFLNFDNEEDRKIARAYFESSVGVIGFGFGHISNDGIWSFLEDNGEVIKSAEMFIARLKLMGIEKVENQTASDILLENQMEFLEKLGRKPSDVSNEEYAKSTEFRELKEQYKKQAELAWEYKKKAEKPFEELDKFKNGLSEKFFNMGREIERRLIIDNYYDLLNDGDKKIVDNNLAFDSTDLADHNLFFGGDPLTAGLLVAFSQESSEGLIDPNVGNNQKESIWDARIEYLKRKGFDFSNFKLIKDRLLTENWYEIDKVKEFLPSLEAVEKIEETRKLAYENYQKEMAIMCIISEYKPIDINENTAEAILGRIQTCTSSSENGIIEEIIIYFCPYDSHDVDLMHEIRHGMTTSGEMTEDGFEVIKIGNKISIFKDSTLIEEKHVNYNEAVTQYEARRETEFSWAKGIYIIDEVGMHLSQIENNAYDNWLPNFSIIYESLPESVKMSQIEQNNNSLYDVIPEDLLSKIETLITNTNSWEEDKVQTELSVIADGLKNMKKTH